MCVLEDERFTVAKHKDFSSVAQSSKILNIPQFSHQVNKKDHSFDL